MRIRLISDGDVGGAIATADPATGIDVLLGVGGAPEGVLAAAALRCFGGDMQGVLQFRNDEERARATRMGIAEFNHIYGIDELASGDVMFAATGVTDGFLLKGVRYTAAGAETSSIVMRSRSGHGPLPVDAPPLRGAPDSTTAAATSADAPAECLSLRRRGSARLPPIQRARSSSG